MRWEVIKMIAIFAFCLWVVAMATGCIAALSFNECDGDTTCEDRSIKREDMRVRREAIQFEKDQCLYPRTWDNLTRACRAQPLY